MKNESGFLFGVEVFQPNVEGRRLRMQYLWAPVIASLVVGVSLALPLFLYLRQAKLEQSAQR